MSIAFRVYADNKTILSHTETNLGHNDIILLRKVSL